MPRPVFHDAPNVATSNLSSKTFVMLIQASRLGCKIAKSSRSSPVPYSPEAISLESLVKGKKANLVAHALLV